VLFRYYFFHAHFLSIISETVLNGATIRSAIDKHDSGGFISKAALNPRIPDPMVACYIEQSFPAMLLFAYRYSEAQGYSAGTTNTGTDTSTDGTTGSVAEGILASANAGGKALTLHFLFVRLFVVLLHANKFFLYFLRCVPVPVLIGENVARGALLGALLGAQYGLAGCSGGFPEWTIRGLHDSTAVLQEIDGLVSASTAHGVAK
jgi:hypothetical protein